MYQDVIALISWENCFILFIRIRTNCFPLFVEIGDAKEVDELANPYPFIMNTYNIASPEEMALHRDGNYIFLFKLFIVQLFIAFLNIILVLIFLFLTI